MTLIAGSGRSGLVVTRVQALQVLGAGAVLAGAVAAPALVVPLLGLALMVLLAVVWRPVGEAGRSALVLSLAGVCVLAGLASSLAVPGCPAVLGAFVLPFMALSAWASVRR